MIKKAKAVLLMQSLTFFEV